GEGTPESRVEFEKHLAECPECQASLERLKALVPRVNERLREPLDTSVDGMMRLMQRAQEELNTQRAEQTSRRRRVWVLVGAALAFAVAATALVLLTRPQTAPNRERVYSPTPPNADGG